MRAAQSKSARVEGRAWFRWAARAGLAGRGVIYGILCVFAVEIAHHGNSSAPASGEGAVAEVARQPAGPALVIVLACGFACYALWRAIEAFSGRERPGRVRSGWIRLGWLVIAAIYAALFVRSIMLLAQGNPGSAGGSQNAEAWAGVVIRWPVGQALLGAAGVGVLIGGVSLAIWGVLHDYDSELQLERLPRWARSLPRIVGSAGDVARGGLTVLVGLYLLDAAVDGRASRVKTVDQALRSLAHEGYGVVLIGLIAIGFLCFAVYSLLFEAWLRDL